MKTRQIYCQGVFGLCVISFPPRSNVPACWESDIFSRDCVPPTKVTRRDVPASMLNPALTNRSSQYSCEFRSNFFTLLRGTIPLSCVRMQTQVFVVSEGCCLVLRHRAEAKPAVFLRADEASRIPLTIVSRGLAVVAMTLTRFPRYHATPPSLLSLNVARRLEKVNIFSKS